MIESKQITVAGVDSPVAVFKITNKSGYYVELCNYGAAVLSIVVPDRTGVAGDVVLGYPDLENHLKDGPYMGKTVGRFAGRIAGGRFALNGQAYQLEINNGVNHLHGGSNGLSFRSWNTELAEGHKIRFSTLLRSEEDGYPGDVRLSVEYAWSDDNKLTISYRGMATEDTLVNLTNHTYFNLRGHGTILDHQLRLNAERYLPIDGNSIPTGSIDPVAGTPMDFRAFQAIGEKMDNTWPQLAIDRGYNQCWIVDHYLPDGLVPAVEIRCPDNGRQLRILSDYPGAVVYCGNYFDGTLCGKDHAPLLPYSGIAVEMQYYPDCPNQPGVPSCVVKKGQPFTHRIVCEFGVINL